MTRAKAVFLDRDGVLLVDNGYLVDASQIQILPRVPKALTLLKSAGYLLVLVTNQAVVARGLLSEGQLKDIHSELQEMLMRSQSPRLDAIYACPHHPKATDPVYRQICECRKPSPGMLLDALRVFNIDPSQSFMIGDRGSDILAGKGAGCKTVQVLCGRHLDAPIEQGKGRESTDSSPSADHICSDLYGAALWIISGDN
jgi:D-glycero-D-manno-heptose 1,7-bisphosphate phosphatase